MYLAALVYCQGLEIYRYNVFSQPVAREPRIMTFSFPRGEQKLSLRKYCHRILGWRVLLLPGAADVHLLFG